VVLFALSGVMLVAGLLAARPRMLPGEPPEPAPQATPPQAEGTA
jgi:hypothetical protein